jgi:hypothetical protein
VNELLRTLRPLLLSLAASVGWLVGFAISFAPAQVILADPARQSPKLLAAFFTMAPPPRIDSPGEFLVLVLILGAFLAAGYWLSRGAPDRSVWRQGVRFGALAWLVGVPWFELYLPWNVLHEPMALVLLEAICWGVTLTCCGIAMAFVDRRTNR